MLVERVREPPDRRHERVDGVSFTCVAGPMRRHLTAQNVDCGRHAATLRSARITLTRSVAS
jgi:hypothetical protein